MNVFTTHTLKSAWCIANLKGFVLALKVWTFNTPFQQWTNDSGESQ